MAAMPAIKAKGKKERIVNRRVAPAGSLDLAESEDADTEDAGFLGDALIMHRLSSLRAYTFVTNR
jgi:hypothetical protein